MGTWTYGINDNDKVIASNKHLYDDVYGGKLSSSTALYGYYKEHPEVVPVTMNLIESTHVVQRVSHGHLSGIAGYQSFLQATLTPIKPGALCQYSNGSNIMITPGKMRTLKKVEVPSQKEINSQDENLPDPSAIIRPDFIQQFPLHPEIGQVRLTINRLI
jgi:hypothetical protein